MSRFTIKICDVGRYAVGTIDAGGNFVEHGVAATMEGASRCIATEQVGASLEESLAPSLRNSASSARPVAWSGLAS